MLIGIIGKTNVGKSTFFKALTLANVEISNRPFTTINPNIGVGYIKLECPCKFFNVKCNPKDGYCIKQRRFAPVKVIDVAGLVPGASEGRGLGNKFLDDLRQADGFILVIDASGTTDEEGNPTKGYNPLNDVHFVRDELRKWFHKIVSNHWDKIKRKSLVTKKDFDKELASTLSGLGITYDDVIKVSKLIGNERLIEYNDELIKEFSYKLVDCSKPFVVAANKIDLNESKKNFKEIKKELKKEGIAVFPTSSESEIALKMASRNGYIEYIPGEDYIRVIKELNERQKEGLKYIEEKVIKPFGSTGVQNTIDYLAFNVLKWKVVFPVENENKLSDKEGNVLPNAIVLEEKDRVIDLAYKIHEDIGKNFKRALLVKEKKIVGKEYLLKNGDVVKIFV